MFFLLIFKMNNVEVTKEKLENYFDVTNKAFEIIQKNVVEGEEKGAEEVFSMVKNYLSDAKYFEGRGEFVDAFAALNYAHGWIDCGVRLGIFDVHDDKLFTIN